MTKRMLSNIEKLAADIAVSAAKAEKLSEKIDALRALAPFYASLRKAKSSEDDDETTMAGLKAELEKAEHNGSEIQHRRGRRADA